jgi:glycosyltransferase involved in cell wall biosynthesis
MGTSMLDLTTFLSLTRSQTSGIPVALYMHENQLTYPLPTEPSQGPMRRQHGERDYHYSFVNYSSMLAADRVFFNSQYHLTSFFDALPSFLKHFPEFNELESIDGLRGKSEVLPVGVDLRRLDRLPGHRDSPGYTSVNPAADSPLILWNQRWEYDKNPGGFFDALTHVANQGIDFKLALCGQRFSRQPKEFDVAFDRFSDRIIHRGYAEEPLYADLLRRADVTVSTASHEFFGISIIEAIYCHTFPILPRALSYPELLPSQVHTDCLYDDLEGLTERLIRALTERERTTEALGKLSAAVAGFDWARQAPDYDRRMASITTIF